MVIEDPSDTWSKWHNLPMEAWRQVLLCLSPTDLVHAAQTCRGLSVAAMECCVAREAAAGRRVAELLPARETSMLDYLMWRARLSTEPRDTVFAGVLCSGVVEAEYGRLTIWGSNEDSSWDDCGSGARLSSGRLL